MQTNTVDPSNALQAGREDLVNFFTACTLQDEVKVISTRLLENRVTSLSEKEVKLFWTNNTLQSYLDCDRAPRGLRSYKEISQYQEDKEFVLQWKQVHLDHAQNLVKITLDRSKVEYDRVCADLQTAKDELVKRFTEAQWQTLERKIEKKLIPIQNDIKERKRDKFLRDKLDYDLDRVFTWHTMQKNRRPFKGGRGRRQKRPQADYWTTDSGSDSSTTEDGPRHGHANNMATSGNVAPSSTTPLGAGHAEGGDIRIRNQNMRGGTKRKQVSWR